MHALCFAVLGTELRISCMLNAIPLKYLRSPFYLLFSDFYKATKAGLTRQSLCLDLPRIVGITGLCHQIGLKCLCSEYECYRKQFLPKSIQYFTHVHHPTQNLFHSMGKGALQIKFRPLGRSSILESSERKTGTWTSASAWSRSPWNPPTQYLDSGPEKYGAF